MNYRDLGDQVKLYTKGLNATAAGFMHHTDATALEEVTGYVP